MPPAIRDHDLYRIGHMMDFCEKLVTIERKHPSEIGAKDSVETLATLRLFKLLGEAASRVSNELEWKYPKHPLRDAIGLRDRLIHSYDDVEYHLLSKAITEDIPPMLEQLRTLDRAIRSSSSV